MLNSQEQVDWSTQTQMILDWEAATTATSTWSGCSHQRVDRDAWLRTWQFADLTPRQTYQEQNPCVEEDAGDAILRLLIPIVQSMRVVATDTETQ